MVSTFLYLWNQRLLFNKQYVCVCGGGGGGDAVLCPNNASLLHLIKTDMKCFFMDAPHPDKYETSGFWPHKATNTYPSADSRHQREEGEWEMAKINDKILVIKVKMTGFVKVGIDKRISNLCILNLL